jgi:L-lactate dehydrogenase complex protein LldG
MSSKETILAAIRKNTLKQYDKPDMSVDAIAFPDKEAQFTESLKASGGTAVYMQPGDDLEQIIHEHFPEAKRIASNLPDMKCATFNPDDVADPRELNNTDLAIIKGEFAVAENGAVWIPKTVKYKGLYFISSNLVILVKKGEIVNNMHEAYRKLEGKNYDFGVFISGPSKTADIEQALVFGAHGPIGVVVVFVP